MIVFGRETEADLVGHSAGLRGRVRSTFSWEHLICPTLLGQRERFSCTRTAHGNRTWTGARSVCVMYIRFPLSVYIDSNRRDF
jgi:hypothetical protein